MNPTNGVKTAEDIAQSQFVFSILFIILLGFVLWNVKLMLDRMSRENQEMEDKNDEVIEKMQMLHEARQEQLQKIIDENKQESREREAQLMTHNNTLLSQLQTQTNSLEEITRTQASMQETQEKMQRNLSDLQDSFEKIESRIEKIENKTNNKTNKEDDE